MQRIHMKNQHSEIFEPQSLVESNKPIYWINARHLHTGYLDHVMAVFDRIGYSKGGPDSEWDVLWSHDYPFTELQDKISKMRSHQKVNHIPGSGFITNKVTLVLSDIEYIPKAFQMPQQKFSFKQYVKEHPEKLWVQKSNNHRGIHVRNVEELDFSADNTFVQEFIQNPYLVDGKKFDIGIYTVVASVDPLRVYFYSGDCLIRYCGKEYVMDKFDDVNTYVVTDDYTPTWKMPSLQKYYIDMKFSHKESLYAHMRSEDLDPTKVDRQIEDAIRKVFLSKLPQLRQSLEKYQHKNIFFELTRFDFVLDEDLNLYLMEVNMSPNLSTGHFAANKLLYQQVIYNTLSVVDVARNIPVSLKLSTEDQELMRVSLRDIQTDPEACSSEECKGCHEVKCQLCNRCLNNEVRNALSDSFLEHLNRRQMKRVYPESLTRDESMRYQDALDDGLPTNDKLLRKWYRSKCIQEESWCY
ncbi:probable tubulin polyglutamylase ttll-15 isoform X2 [Anneissia japonica]|nr:probable tubulin polyglutamylase ttll-15 isoform X2 [Anneissia japonica]XP_033096624.1 probable tubulin polyglutamylase ttll-15 isoform X2 [Anneissia japonica]